MIGPKPKPKRVAITAQPALIDALEQLGEAMDKPPSTVAGELLTEMIPSMLELARIARIAKAGKTQAARDALRRLIGDKAGELLAEDQPDLFARSKGKAPAE